MSTNRFDVSTLFPYNGIFHEMFTKETYRFNTIFVKLVYDSNKGE